MSTEQESSRGELTEHLSLLDVAIREYQHAENIIQARLYNFLFADSILLVSWAAVYAGGAAKHKVVVLALLACLSVILGLLWIILGCRHRKFLFVHTQLITDAEALLPERYRIHKRITDLQCGGAVLVGTKTFRLTRLEAFTRSRNIGIIAPFLMTVISILLMFVSCTY